MRHSHEIKEKILKLYTEGRTGESLEKEFKIPCSTIYRWALNNGSRKMKIYSEDLKEKIIQLYDQGEDINSLSTKYNVPYKTIYLWSLRSDRKKINHYSKDLKEKINKPVTNVRPSEIAQLKAHIKDCHRIIHFLTQWHKDT